MGRTPGSLLCTEVPATGPVHSRTVAGGGQWRGGWPPRQQGAYGACTSIERGEPVTGFLGQKEEPDEGRDGRNGQRAGCGKRARGKPTPSTRSRRWEEGVMGRPAPRLSRHGSPCGFGREVPDGTTSGADPVPPASRLSNKAADRARPRARPGRDRKSRGPARVALSRCRRASLRRAAAPPGSSALRDSRGPGRAAIFLREPAHFVV